MVSKARIEQLKKARAASFHTYKRRRNARQIENNETYLQINDDDEDSKADTTDTEAPARLLNPHKRWRVDENPDSVNETELQIQDDSDEDKLNNADTEEPGDWFWNEGANESESDSEEEGRPNSDKSDSDSEVPKTETEVSSVICPKELQPSTERVASPIVKPEEIQWRENTDAKLQGAWGNGSKATHEKKKREAKRLEKKAKNTYNIGALWKRYQDMRMESGSRPRVVGVKSPLSSSEELERDIPTPPTLSEVPHGCASPTPKSRRVIKKEMRVKASHDLKRLLDLVTE